MCVPMCVCARACVRQKSWLAEGEEEEGIYRAGYTASRMSGQRQLCSPLYTLGVLNKPSRRLWTIQNSASDDTFAALVRFKKASKLGDVTEFQRVTISNPSDNNSDPSTSSKLKLHAWTCHFYLRRSKSNKKMKSLHSLAALLNSLLSSHCSSYPLC